MVNKNIKNNNSNKQKKGKKSIPDKRNLGTEWKNWDGNKNENTDATIGLFLLLSFFVMVIFSLLLLFGHFMINPRLESIHPLLPEIFMISIFIFISLMVVWILLLILSLFFNINLMLGLEKKIFNLLSLFPHAAKLAKKIGINRDRVGNSFIKLNNNIVKIKRNKFGTCDLMILLPRCLNKQVNEKIKEIGSKYSVASFTVPGGEKARELIKEKKPKAIIAVACERDLVAGIKDISKIQVYGIPNKRPQGPCKNTIVNIKELEKSIRMFLGVA